MINKFCGNDLKVINNEKKLLDSLGEQLEEYGYDKKIRALFSITQNSDGSCDFFFNGDLSIERLFYQFDFVKQKIIGYYDND